MDDKPFSLCNANAGPVPESELSAFCEGFGEPDYLFGCSSRLSSGENVEMNGFMQLMCRSNSTWVNSVML